MGNPTPAIPVINWTSPTTNNPHGQHKIGRMKPFQASINDADGFKMRAACVCVKSKKEQEVLLVSSMGGRGWIIPGGKVEPFEVDNPSVSAIREAREEGGVRGCLRKCRLISFKDCLALTGQLGRYLGEFENKEKGHRTRVFVLYVESLDTEEEWKESVRERRWFSLQDAKEVLKKNKPNHVKYIETMIQTQTMTES